MSISDQSLATVAVFLPTVLIESPSMQTLVFEQGNTTLLYLDFKSHYFIFHNSSNLPIRRLIFSLISTLIK